jgi:hypothetical protein
MDKSKSKSKRFSHIAFHLLYSEFEIPNTASACCHIAFHLLHSEIEIPNTASACCHIALHLLHSEFEIPNTASACPILLFICCTRNFDCAAGKWKTDELQIKISNGLLNSSQTT